MIWTDEADDLLIRLWDEGGSLSYVADGMKKAGYTVTRNAVSGRRHRLPVQAFRRKTATTATKVVTIERQPQQRSKPMTKTPSRGPVTTIEIDAIARHPGVEYLDNDYHGCKAIMPSRGGPWDLQRVCGRPRGTDYNGNMSPYCPTHFRMFTNPVAARKQHG